MTKVVFILPPFLEMLDLAGPLQVFNESKFYGLDIEIQFYSIEQKVVCSAGLPFGSIENFENAVLSAGDFIFIPGVQFEALENYIFNQTPFFNWIASNSEKGVNICSVCNATFILGKAGLLDHKECTTHWRRVDALKTLFPKTTVLSDVLYVHSDNIYTSAGISSGIDMALAILEELTHARFVNKVARGLVVYHRRSSKHCQRSIYLDYRNHINPKIHQVQDYLVENISSKISIEELAGLACMSSRNLSRVFKEVTEITIVDYLTKLRIEKAKTLKNNPDYTVEFIATECGFKSARQLQRILKNSPVSSN
jgi:transcriptional regulator GlxA family with amidase domain